MIQLQHVYQSYGNAETSVPILTDFCLTVKPGERCVLIGPSGCGKSTLLLVIAGLLRADQGLIRIDRQEISGPRRHTSLILQDYGLFPWKRVVENIALGLCLQGVRKREAACRVQPVIKRLGLSGLEQRYPGQLSGGQRQRVAVGRALATEPDLLLMDEPFSSLDALTRESLQNLTLEIAGRDQLTIVLVTHNIEEAAFLGHRILVLDGPPLTLIGTVENQLSTTGYRGQAAFYETCTRIRSLLQHCSQRFED
ncbi:MAG: ABC transporter ATP-binding protein [Heliobacteriaceae bacterium]|nr:ABC transporter ATP-binding protein [Heliobacteriaceae bacterium]MDD4587487.1 ABC transporter ATP-binding protein [Heliobacteriaceae bacterium]